MVLTELEKQREWENWIELLLKAWDVIKKFKEAAETGNISLAKEEETLLLNIHDLAEMIVQLQTSYGDEEQMNQRQFCCLFGVATLFTTFLRNRCAEEEAFRRSFDVCLESLANYLTFFEMDELNALALRLEYLDTFDEDPMRAIYAAWGKRFPQRTFIDSIMAWVSPIAPKVFPAVRTIAKTALTATVAKVGNLAREDAHTVVKEILSDVFQPGEKSGLQ